MPISSQNALLRRMISQLPDRDQAKVKEIAEKIRALAKETPPLGMLALGLVGTEVAGK